MRGHRLAHNFGRGARIIGRDLERRRRDFRVLSNRKREIGRGAGDCYEYRQDDREDWPIDEEVGDAHGDDSYCSGEMGGGAKVAVTLSPGRSITRLSMITRSVGSSPLVTTRIPLSVRVPIVTCLDAAVPSACAT